MILVSDHTNPPTPPQRSYLHSASSAASSSSYRQRQQQQTALARQPPLDLACYCSSGWRWFQESAAAGQRLSEPFQVIA